MFHDVVLTKKSERMSSSSWLLTTFHVYQWFRDQLQVRLRFRVITFCGFHYINFFLTLKKSETHIQLSVVCIAEVYDFCIKENELVDKPSWIQQIVLTPLIQNDGCVRVNSRVFSCFLLHPSNTSFVMCPLHKATDVWRVHSHQCLRPDFRWVTGSYATLDQNISIHD